MPILFIYKKEFKMLVLTRNAVLMLVLDELLLHIEHLVDQLLLLLLQSRNVAHGSLPTAFCLESTSQNKMR